MTEKDDKNTPQENSSVPDDDLDSLSDDEKAAFEKILAEINAGDQKQEADTEADPPPASSDTDSPDEALSDDQQAALDKIMAEINARDDKAEADAEADPPPASSDTDRPDEALSDDQQAALDKIMAEINARDDKAEADTEADPPPASSDADSPDEALSDDQQAALDKIMAEINARDDKAEADAGPEQEPGAVDKNAPTQGPGPDSDRLSFDEFNDELDNLLSKAQSDLSEKEPTDESSMGGEPTSQPGAETPDSPSPEISSLKYGPAPQPADLSSTVPDADKEEDPADPSTNPVEKHQQAYAVLQEIDPDQGSKSGPTRKVRQNKLKHAGLGRFYKAGFIALAVLAAVGLIYWGLGRWNHRTLPEPAPAGPPPEAQVSVGSGDLATTTDLQPAPVVRSEQEEIAAVSPSRSGGSPLRSLQSDLAAAREQVAGKIEEVTNLIGYLEEGIQEELRKIRAVLADNPLPPVEKALADSQIELGFRAIQRRRAYISKLGAPLEQLKASSEELLFLERRTQLFEILGQWIGGPSIPQYRQEIAERIQIHMKTIKELSVDNTQMDLPSMASVWVEVKAGLEKEKALAAQRSKISSRDRRISQEICDGEFDRKYLLTHLSEETAACLVQWSGKDLYLNGLSELSPQSARILAQWPGEWLSLNGIKKLSAESARYLAQWPGKRLSLNGLEKLSPQATAELSKWRGEQLEMIGLTAIGPWENYATKLYLSETMRRKLQM